MTLFFLVAAVLIFLQLRSVLGRRTGNEKPPVDPFARSTSNPAGSTEEDKVVTLAKRDDAEPENRYAAIDAFAAPETALNTQLRQIADVDPSFSPKEFLKGARIAYEMIVMAFAAGDRKTLKGLLSRDVFEGFDAAITERERRGELLKSTFVGIDRADIVSASVKDNEELLTVKIISQLISATYDKNGELIDGDAENVGEVNDIWTFARDIRSRDPNWKLIATESEQ
ncbi:putative lipid-binding transport protein (Tim44 family) [Rhizobium paknamense]|uniref:Lipid-binding transport protein (Tim44 family) n=1 Tax=Rhizobium paknamense TaxID=1206817 RepID=A0ABU0II61_9HYPH|nr:putative lipid-binding transport protein (Tim44 family) [Rhizobium paknamense]